MSIVNLFLGSSFPQEKMTDVNIAVELLQDAFDTAFLMSADSDLIAPLAVVKRLFSEKRIVVAYPPGCFSVNLSKAASAYFQIDRIPIAKGQFPEEVRKPSGYVLRWPESWM